MDGAGLLGEGVSESGATGLVESDSVTFCRFGVPLTSVAGSAGGSPGSFASGLGSFLLAAGRFLFGGGAGGRPSGNTSSGRSALCAEREYSKDLFLGGGGGE